MKSFGGAPKVLKFKRKHLEVHERYADPVVENREDPVIDNILSPDVEGIELEFQTCHLLENQEF